MTRQHAQRRILLIIGYEPSWFAECISAIGVALWAVFTFLTDDFLISGWEWLMPLLGVPFALARASLLFRLTPVPRVLAAMAAFMWWTSIATGLYSKFGVTPALGAYLALAIGDALTVAKFSIASIQAREAHG